MRKAKRTPTAYSATIHTATLEPVLPEGQTENAWMQDMRNRFKDGALPYLSRIYRDSADGSPRVKVNLYKRHTDSEGNFVFEYWPLSRFLGELEMIAHDLGAEGFIIRRLDIAIDAPVPYERTAKIIRLILLALADSHALNNRYMSTDPMTGTMKALRVDNGGNKFTLQVEHYNRATVDQSGWNRAVMNRLELRTAKEQAGQNHDARQIALNWLERFGALPDKLRPVIDAQSLSLLDDWSEFSKACGKETANAINAFIIQNERRFYTREQVRDFLGAVMDAGKNSDKSFNNFLHRWGGLLELYTLDEYEHELLAITEALSDFIRE